MITRHAPTRHCLGFLPWGHRYALYPLGVHLNAAYVNAWEDPIGKANLWLYGHLHAAFDKVVNRTQLVSNPRGYDGEQTGSDPVKVIGI